MRRFSLAAAVAVMILSGCDAFGSSTDVSFQTESASYAPGSEVALRLENGPGVAIGYNICFAFVELERRQAGEWQVIPSGLGPDLGPDLAAGCTGALYGLAPSESAESRVWLPESLEAGRYRLATDVEIGIDRGRYDRARVVTNPFEVE